ncbi:hypothetical protein DEJ28_14200 [Curtobacterium sp. MCPF17_002]|uniref:hypothetical protein n=1 Tax=Curtobacterium sp. MCPF17_002 TaxID=2175645 RepID=UPI000DA92C2B|nr:hypothetical protein [Curtobacterium sp. MCPF17_002]WIB76794.1 hypothetical protein DEJ28_14200 [Curtobacterium sp. MCPF17_002]
MGNENDPNENPNAEAARYRTQLRAAEATIAERDAAIETMQSALAAAQRGQIEGVVAQHSQLRGEEYAPRMKHPGDLWALSGRTPDEFLTDDGQIDREALAEALDGLVQDRPYLVEAYVQPVPPDPIRTAMERQQQTPGAQAGVDTDQAWAKAFEESKKQE